MKKETYAQKLAKLLGLEEVHQEVVKKKTNTYNRAEAISEDRIQSFRAAQGIIYFLQAPRLFSLKKCTHCGEEFLVSRQFVACCSYTCITKGLEEKGIQWSKGEDLEALANDPNVYEGNEPIWIRNLDQLEAALRSLTESRSSLASTSPQVPSG